jgi:hypothetical protein
MGVFRENSIVPVGSSFSLKVSAGDGYISTYQAIETSETLRFAGNYATLTAKVAASTYLSMYAEILYSTVEDENPNTGTFTSLGSGTAVPYTTAGFISISYTGFIPATAKTLKIVIGTSNDIGSIGSVVDQYISQVKLEVGTVATPFSLAGGTARGDLAECQRYYYRLSGGADLQPVCMAAYYSTTLAFGQINFPVPMRTVPSGASSSDSALAVYSAGSARTTSNVLPQTTVVSKEMMEFRFTTSATTTGNAAFVRFPVSSTNYLEFDAEL